MANKKEVKKETKVDEKKTFEDFDSVLFIGTKEGEEPLITLNLATQEIKYKDGITPSEGAAIFWQQAMKIHSNMIQFFDWNVRSAISLLFHIAEKHKDDQIYNELTPVLNTLSNVIRVASDYKQVKAASDKMDEVKEKTAE